MRTRALPLAALALCAALAAAPAARAQLYNARMLLTWQQYETGTLSSSGFRQTYEGGLRKAISEPFQIRVWFRADGADNDFELDSQSSSTSFQQLRLGGELTVSYPVFSLRVRWDDIETDLGGARSGDRQLNRGTAIMSWRPEGLPDLTLQAELRGFSDELRGEDRTDRRLQATVSETYGPLFVAGTLRSTELDDARGSLRDTDEVQGQVGLNLAFFDDRLTTSTQLYVHDSRIDERGVGPAGAPVSELLPILAASTGVDETPEDARDRPLDPAGGLVDGLLVPTGIALGPGGQTFRNVALDLGRFAAVDELRLYVRGPNGELIPTGGPLEWRVYVSDDRLDWRLVFGSATRFDPAQSLYEVTFPRRSTRHLKVVSFGLNLVDTDLVEVEAFDSTAIAPGERRISDSRLATAETTLTARPVERVTASWSSRWNLFRRTRPGQPESRTEDATHYATLLFEPLEWMDVQLRWERRSTDLSTGFDQDFEQWATDLIFLPRDGLDFRLEALHSRDDSAGQEIETDGLALKSHARLWRALDLRLDVGELRYERLTDRLTERRRYANGWAIAQLTKALQVRATLTAVDSDVDGEAGVSQLTADERRWSVEGYWRAGTPLGLGLRVGRVTSDDFAASIRALRLEWSPFRGGALRLNTTYDEEADTLSRRTFRRLTVAPGWTINRYTLLNLTYTIFDFGGEGALRTESFLANLQVRR